MSKKFYSIPARSVKATFSSEEDYPQNTQSNHDKPDQRIAPFPAGMKIVSINKSSLR